MFSKLIPLIVKGGGVCFIGFSLSIRNLPFVYFFHHFYVIKNPFQFNVFATLVFYRIQSSFYISKFPPYVFSFSILLNTNTYYRGVLVLGSALCSALCPGGATESAANAAAEAVGQRNGTRGIRDADPPAQDV